MSLIDKCAIDWAAFIIGFAGYVAATLFAFETKGPILGSAMILVPITIWVILRMTLLK